MSTIASIATAVPPHCIPLADTLSHAARVFTAGATRGDHALNLIERCGIERRYLVEPVTDVTTPRSLTDTSLRYQKHAIALALDVVGPALAEAGLTPRHIDHIITVSCTGVMIPSLDAELMNRLPFRSDCRRTPITELGCAAGAVAIARAHDHVAAHPGETALVIAVEIPSLTFQRHDQSMTNLVASAIFADGAAAAVITDRPARGPRILDTRSELFPDTQYIMGFDLRDGGFHIKLDRELTPLLDRAFEPALARFLAPHHMTARDLQFFALHPGGRRLLEVLQDRLHVAADQTFASWDVLRDYGNMSSATVLFVLDRLRRERPPPGGSIGLLAAFGPGFSAEMALLQWN